MANAFETEEEMIERAKQASLTDGADPPTYVDDRPAPPGYVEVPSHDVDADDEDDDLYRGASANTQDAIRLSLQGGLQAQTSGGSSTGAVADSDDSGYGDDQWRPPEPTVGAPSPAPSPPEEPPREPEPEPAASPHSPHVEPPYVAELVSGSSATHNQVKMVSSPFFSRRRPPDFPPSCRRPCCGLLKTKGPRSQRTTLGAPWTPC